MTNSIKYYKLPDLPPTNHHSHEPYLRSYRKITTEEHPQGVWQREVVETFKATNGATFSEFIQGLEESLVEPFTHFDNSCIRVTGWRQDVSPEEVLEILLHLKRSTEKDAWTIIDQAKRECESLLAKCAELDDEIQALGNLETIDHTDHSGFVNQIADELSQAIASALSTIQKSPPEGGN